MLELATHLEGKAAQLRRKGFGKKKIALTGTRYLFKILEGCFSYMDLNTSQSTASQRKLKRRLKRKPLFPPHKSQSSLPAVAVWPMQSLHFPLKSTPAVTAGLLEVYLPICGPETLSQYCCQFPSCSLTVSQKAAACNHVCHDHLNVALACLYYSFKHTPKCDGTVYLPGNTIP